MTNKIKKIFSSMLALILSITLFNIDVKASENKTDEQIIGEMMYMQDQITETLVLRQEKGLIK